MRLRVVRVRGGKQFAHHRQRPRMAASRLRATSGISRHDQRLASLFEIPRILRLFRDFPEAGETHAARMKNTEVTFPVDAPAQIRVRIDGPRRGLAERVSLSESRDAAEHAGQGNSINGPQSLGVTAPIPLIRIGEDSIPHFSEARSAVGAIFLGDRLRPKKFWFHNSLPLAPANAPVRQLSTDF
jgi:hypothetical protein